MRPTLNPTLKRCAFQSVFHVIFLAATALLTGLTAGEEPATTATAGKQPQANTSVPPAQVDLRRAFAERLYQEYGQETKKAPKHKPTPSAAPNDADQFRIWSTDRHPTDILMRRTLALWREISPHLEATRRRDLEANLNLWTERVQSLTVDAAGVFTELYQFQRLLALSDPRWACDDLLFTIMGHGHMVIQGYPLLLPSGGAAIYRLRDIRSPEPRLEDVLHGKVVTAGPLKNTVLEGEQQRFGGIALSYDGTELVFSHSLGRDPQGYARTEIERGYQRLQALYFHGRRGDMVGYQEAYAQRSLGTMFHLYRHRLDSGEIRPVTDHPLFNDVMPVWLPNGEIAFCSDRIQGMERCGGMRPSTVLCSIRPDGTGFSHLSYHEINEWQPSVNDHGMLVFTRWDYLDRGFNHHNLWTAFPDGRDPRAPFGNYFIPRAPDGTEMGPEPFSMGFRAIPGASNKYIAIRTTHHSGTQTGYLIVVDLNMPETQRGVWRPFCQRLTFGRKFSEPFPLHERQVLTAEDGRILLIDSFGNEILLYDGTHLIRKGMCIRHPLPIKSQPRPPIIPRYRHDGVAEGKEHQARVALMNVYDTDYPWPESERITALRIVQVLPKMWPYSGNRPSPQIGWVRESPARFPLGTVPVEEDGSAHFIVPAGREIYFQALNARGLAVQSMLSSTHTFPGEFLTCRGCHEPKDKARGNKALPRALSRPPSRITPEANQGEPLNFHRLVKPIFEAKCLPCHRKQDQGIVFDYWMPKLIAPGDRYMGFPGVIKRDGKELHPYYRMLIRYVAVVNNITDPGMGVTDFRIGERIQTYDDPADADIVRRLYGPTGAAPIQYYWNPIKPLIWPEGGGSLVNNSPWRPGMDFRLGAPNHVDGGWNPHWNDFNSVPLRQGAIASPLLRHLDPSHHGVQLTPEEFRRIVLWMDLNSLELGSFNDLPELVERQRRGEIVWPEGIDPQDPIHGVYDPTGHFLRECAALGRGAP